MAATRGLIQPYLFFKNFANAAVYVPHRAYARRLHRNPIKIYPSEEIASPKKFSEKQIAVNDDLANSRKYEIASKIRKASEPTSHGIKTFQTPSPEQEVKEKKSFKKPDLKIISEKLTAERKLGSYMQMVKSSKARKANKKILLEGERLIGDALKSGLNAEALFCSKPELIDSLPTQISSSTKVYQVNYNKIQLWSELSTSPGIIGIFDLEKIENNHTVNPGCIPLTLLCDNVKDPGNMGSLLRCAAAVGCDQFITTKGCVDVWDSKVLRSAVGAHFRINKTLDVEWNSMCNYVPEDATIILADSSAIDPKKIIDQEQLAKLLVKAEEANQNSISLEKDDEGNIHKTDTSYNDTNLLQVYRHLPLPSAPYDQMKLRDTRKVFLVIGGETHGISPSAYKLAHDLGGIKVYIPMENGVDSLNAGVACGVLAFEIRRQLQMIHSQRSVMESVV